jgi:hypothetical protein
MSKLGRWRPLLELYDLQQPSMEWFRRGGLRCSCSSRPSSREIVTVMLHGLGISADSLGPKPGFLGACSVNQFPYQRRMLGNDSFACTRGSIPRLQTTICSLLPTFLIVKSGVLDYDLQLFVDVATVLDRHISVVSDKSVDVDMADQMGLFDRAEHACGLGFVACQAYLASTYSDLRIVKSAALSAGPDHRYGGKVTAIINAAANFWKHHHEWEMAPGHPGQKRTQESFDSVGFPVNSEYPLCGVLAELAAPHEARLLALVPVLEAWRDELASSVS